MVGIPVGMLARRNARNKWPDRFISALALLGFSIPVFWRGALLTLFAFAHARVAAGDRAI